MKTHLSRIIPFIAILFALSSCMEAAGPKDKGVEAKGPAVKVKQKVKTPTLMKHEPAAPKEPTAKKADEVSDVVPGTPLETPPIPSAITEPKEEPPKQELPKPIEIAEKIEFKPTTVVSATSIDVLVDASGSMNAPLGITEFTKFEMVKDALEDVLLTASQQREFPRNIGIRVFGAAKPVSEGDCTDTDSIIEIGPLDLKNFVTTLREVKPQGLSPIATALEEAVKDFPADFVGDRVVVLIADGADTCQGDPCSVAAQLHSAPQKVIVQVIGFDVSAQDQSTLQCMADRSGGIFQLARNEAELRRAIDQALNANVPYNLRLTVTAGPVPLPATITVLQAGTQNVVSKDKSFGSKIFKLNPGTYDILVEHTDSMEKRKPSKMIRGVEILGTTKAEQSINFDLGQLTLSATDNENKLIPARYHIVRSGTSTTVAEFDTGAQPQSMSLTPGKYDITATQLGIPAEQLILTDKGVKVVKGETVERTFRFQKGTLALRAKTTQGQNMPFMFQISAPERGDAVIASGATTRSGTRISLSPGTYELIATADDPSLPAEPRTKVTGIVMTAGQTTDLAVRFEMGRLMFSAVDDQEQPVAAEFKIQDISNEMIIATVKGTGAEPVTVDVPPGTYRVMALRDVGNVEPKPTIVMDNVKVSAETPISKRAKFVLGTLRVRGTNTKEEPLLSQFTLYRTGTEDVVSASKPTDQWVVFEVAPGRYDIKATDMTATQADKPSITISDLKVEAGKTVSHQSIFTAGKIKIIGRGPNNKIITVGFKIFQYGADRELINGKTGEDWVSFEIPPGKYYLEAGYVDPIQTVLLKKWVNITVGTNEVVEQVLRF
jgi:Ca-activated chloride channel family protein